MKQYLDALQYVLDNGVERSDRTGTGTLAVFGMQQRYDLSKGFPAVTTKKLAWRSVVSELLWFIEGSGDERRLREILHGSRDSEKSTIWTDNATAPYWKPHARFDGDLGRIYGVQWRKWKTVKHTKVGSIKDEFGSYYSVQGGMQEVEIDQLRELVDGIIRDPYGRRHIISAWNPGELKSMALPPCHVFAQFFVAPLSQDEINETYMAFRNTQSDEMKKVMDVGREGRAKTKEDLKAFGLPTDKLSCQMYQRSCDMFLGVPFNIASYSLLTMMLARVCNLKAGEFVHVLGDAHVYLNHVEQVKEQLTREPLPLPQLILNPNIKDITRFTMDDIRLENYTSHSSISAPMAV